MINNYALFNDHDNNNNLYILFSDAQITNKQSQKEVELLFNNDVLVGYMIPDFIRFAKIKYSGIIFLPNNILIDVINSVIKNSGLEPLSYKTSSGYMIKRNGDKLGVYATNGTFLRDRTISKGRFCTYYDLFIENNDLKSLIEIDEESLEGKDFYLSKENLWVVKSN